MMKMRRREVRVVMMVGERDVLGRMMLEENGGRRGRRRDRGSCVNRGVGGVRLHVIVFSWQG
jgi:hypothetical protein